MRLMLVYFVLAGSLVLAMLAVTDAAAPPPVRSPRVDAVGDPLPDDALARFGTLRFRETNHASGIALSPDGKLLAVPASEAIRLLDTTTGKEVRRIEGAGRFFIRGTITFAPNGKVLAFSDQSSITMYDVVKGTIVDDFRSLGRISHGSVSFSGDGKLLAVGGRRGNEKLSVSLWDVAEKKEKKKIKTTYDGEVHSVLSPDSKTLAFWGQNPDRQIEGILRLVDVRTGKDRFAVKYDSFDFQNFVFSPDGKHFLAIKRGASPAIRETATGKLVRRFIRCADTTVAVYSPDGTRLAMGGESGSVQVWDTRAGKQIAQCKGPSQTPVMSIAFIQGNHVLAAGIAHQTIRVWDVPSGKERSPTQGHLASVSALAFSRDGKSLLSAGNDGVRVRSLANGKEPRLIGPPLDRFAPRIRGFRRSSSFLSPNGRHLVWADQQGQGLIFVDRHSSKEIDELVPFTNSLTLPFAFSPDGGRMALFDLVFFSEIGQITAQVYDLASGRLIRQIKVSQESRGWSLALSPGGKLLVIAPNHPSGAPAVERIALWDVATGKVSVRLPIISAHNMAFSPDGSMLATNANGVVSLWDTATGQHLLDVEGGGNRFQYQFAFSPDDRLLAVAGGVEGGAPFDVRLWELASRKVRASFTGHVGATLTLAFSPDGRMLASGGTDTTVMLWDVTGITGLSRLHGSKPTPAEQATLWADLDSADAGKAHRAMARLLAWPAETMTLFRKELKPAAGKPPEEKVVQRWIAELGSDSFEVREKASKALSAAGRALQPALAKALARTEDLEKKRRLEGLLSAFRPGPTSENIRLTRAVEVLERLGTPESRQLLRQLAGGNPGARLTSEAADALKRLERKR